MSKTNQNSTTETVESVIDRPTEFMHEKLATVQETAKEISDQAQKQFQTATEEASSFVRKNPGLAMAGALGVGVLLGVALRNR